MLAGATRRCGNHCRLARLHEKALKQVSATATKKREPTPPDFSGHWVNELGSHMELSIGGNAVSGTYTSIVSSDGQQISGPVTGYVAGDVIAFAVLWPLATPSITCWVGQITVQADGTVKLQTLWHLIVDVPDAQDPNGIWTPIHAGSDIFHR
ncbi:avidin/streptavidin family protein [Bradyrhizobium sp. USDA 10063]